MYQSSGLDQELIASVPQSLNIKATDLILDLGCGRNKQPGAIGVDNVSLETVDVVHDLLSVPYPFPPGCAVEIILSHVLEHFSLTDINLIMNEVYRLLSPHGVVTISVPHAFSVAFHSDPTHKTRFTFETLYYFTQEHAFSYYDRLQPKWKISRLWASVNLLNDHFLPAGPRQQKVNKFTSRVMSYLIRRSRTKTLPDLIVKQFPFWLVSIHCKLVKASPSESSQA
jgi:hypothetical protein